jgi:hypothetical protein
MVKQNPRLLKSNAKTQVAAEERGGVAGVVEEGEETKLAMLDYIIYWRFNIIVSRLGRLSLSCLLLFSSGSQER